MWACKRAARAGQPAVFRPLSGARDGVGHNTDFSQFCGWHSGLHSVTATDSGRLVLFAGAPKSGPMLGDLWSLDLASSAWEELDPDGQAWLLPSCRCDILDSIACWQSLLAV